MTISLIQLEGYGPCAGVDPEPEQEDVSDRIKGT
jgi:hypothetical protein